jgi:galactose mutarotase-like enzyme
MKPFREDVQGFTGYGLRSNALEILVVPELGARILRLQSLCSGTEWMWHPPDAMRLFRNRLGDPFEYSTLAGADECVPTIAACEVAGRRLPDHGEAWASAWEIDEDAWSNGALSTRLKLPVSPFEFERRIAMNAGTLRFEYRIRNVSRNEESFLWAFHPLFALLPCDRIELPSDVRSVRVNAAVGCALRAPCAECAWPEPFPSVRFDSLGSGCGKLVADFSGCREGWGAIVRGSRKLSIRFDPYEIPYLGVWFTRGGWHGHTHAALEPTNGASDALLDADGAPYNRLAPGAEQHWSFRLCIEDSTQ